MKRLKGGPELKMPELKVPVALASLYDDLRDRRLLLPLALVVVAIAAVPFLLGSKPDPVPAPPATGPGSAAESAGGKPSTLTVVEAQPGLREYRKRLGGHSAVDPFKQQYTGLPASAQAQVGESTPEGSVTVTETTTTETAEVSEGGAPPSETGDAGPAPTPAPSPAPAPAPTPAPAPAKEYEFVIDAQIAHSEQTPGGEEKLSKWEARHDVPILAQLPGEEATVVTLLGANLHKKRIVFLVSHSVKAIIGEYGCVSRGEICELLEVEPGSLIEYVYEPTGVRYAIKVTNAAVIPKRHKSAARSSRAAFTLSQPDPGFEGR